LLLTGVSRQEAVALTENIRRAVAEAQVTTGDGTALSITVSAGLAFSADAPSAGLEAMLCQADRALYEAKTAGRNRVIARVA